MATAVFAAELLAMAAIAPLQAGPVTQALIDAAIMLALALPVIYWTLVRPVVKLNQTLADEIAQRQQREADLRRAKTIYLELFENVFDGVFEISTDGSIRRINTSLVRMLGYPSAQELLDAFSSNDGPLDEDTRNEWTRCVRAEEEIHNQATVLRRRDGTSVSVVANLLPVRDESRNVLFYQGAVNDVTDRSRALEAERRARKGAETLRAASLTLTRSLDLDDVLATLLELLNDIVPFDRAEVLLVNRDGTVSPRAQRDHMQHDAPSVIPWPEALLLDVIHHGVPVLIPDVREERRWPATATPGSWLGVPLGAPREVLGLYAMYRSGANSLTRDHTAIAEALGAAVAVAIRNASLFDEVGSARARLQRLSRKLVEIQEEERRRIARELHDEAGQALTSLRIGLQLAEQESTDTTRTVARCRELRQVVDGIMTNLHDLATHLRPPSLEHLGLSDAVDQHLRSVSAHSNLKVNFQRSGLSEARLSAAVEITVFRIVQEAVTNVIRHARAKHVDVELDCAGDQVRAVIRDDGRGFDPDQTGGRLGISGMRERAELLGGRLLVRSSAAGGTSIALEVPNGHSAADR